MVAANDASHQGYRDLVVHLDGGSEDDVRLAHAESIAALFGSHVMGLLTRRLPDIAHYPSPGGATARMDLESRIHEENRALRHRLIERFSALKARADLRSVEATIGDLNRHVATEARLADLFVGSCPSGERTKQWSALIEAVLFQGGRGMFLAPEGVRPREIKTVAIRWIDTREAARALAEAIPLLRQAHAAHLICVADQNGPPARGAMIADVAAHLARHGVNVSVDVVAAESGAPAQAILGEARRLSADLIVSGAFGHSKVHDWIVGGATRDLLAQSEIPLLLAH